MPDKVITYLEMIQGAIDRMSTSSAIFKGFAATISAGLLAYFSLEEVGWILLLSILPIICFAFLDIYYLRLERRYRFLYEQVRAEKWEADFRLMPPDPKTILAIDKKANIRIWSCIRSPSIWLFYGLTILTSVIIIIVQVAYLS